MAYDEAAILMPSLNNETSTEENIDIFTDKDLVHEKNLLRVLIGQIKIEAAWLVVPSMQRVFVQAVQTEKLA